MSSSSAQRSKASCCRDHPCPVLAPACISPTPCLCSPSRKMPIRMRETRLLPATLRAVEMAHSSRCKTMACSGNPLGKWRNRPDTSHGQESPAPESPALAGSLLAQLRPLVPKPGSLTPESGLAVLLLSCPALAACSNFGRPSRSMSHIYDFACSRKCANASCEVSLTRLQ